MFETACTTRTMLEQEVKLAAKAVRDVSHPMKLVARRLGREAVRRLEEHIRGHRCK